ncbi:MAG: dienelactone hydrolase family protein, partial [Dehalococcoidia bacterium]
MPSQWTTLDVDGSPMAVYISAPDGDGPHPPVMVGMHAFGLTDFVRGKCDDLAEAGYVAAAPYLYHRQSGPTMDELHAITPEDPKRRDFAMPMKGLLLDDEIARDIEVVLAHVRGLPNVGGPAGITGFCIGGRVAMLMSIRTRDYAACADFYGTDMADAWGDGPSPLSMVADVSCPVAGFFGNLDQNPS